MNGIIKGGFMAQNVMQARTAPTIVEHDFSWPQRYVLRRFHPRSIFVDTVGLIWFTYYFWNHDWKMALSIAIVVRTIAIMSVMSINTDVFSESILGRIALLHLHPLNLAIQLLGTAALLYGVWEHSTEVILTGVSVILLGHIFGWSKVDAKLIDTSN